MNSSRLWSRVRKGRLVQVLLVYLGVSWAVVQVVDDLRSMLGLPQWIGPVTIILLAIGLIIILATAWVQSHPLVDAREQADEVPKSWELDLPEAVASVKQGRLPHLTWSRALVGGVVAFSLLIGVAGLFVLIRGGDVLRPRAASASVAPDGIAVLPFAVRGEALDDWREGMVDLLSTGLDGAGGLRAIASRTVLARWHETVPGDVAPEESVALDVARQIGARYALMGSAVSIGPRVRIALDVYELDGANARRLGAPVQVEGHPDSVLVLVDQLGMQALALVLRDSRADLPPLELANLMTSSLPALKSYLDGEALYRRGDFEGAAQAYERATQIDTLFALAYWRLSQALGWNEDVQSPRARDANRRAIELIERLPARDALLARAGMLTLQYDLNGVRLLEEAVRRYPDDAEAWYQLGDAKYHLPAALVDWEEIEPAFERAAALAPRVTAYRLHLVEGVFRQHADSAMMAEQVAELERIAPNSRQARRYRVAHMLTQGAAAEDSAILSLMGPNLNELGGLVGAALLHPRFAEVKRAWNEGGYKLIPAGRPGIARDMGWQSGLARGRFADARASFRDKHLEPHEWSAYVLWIHVVGVPTPPAVLDSARAEADPRGPGAFVVAAHAATAKQWDAHAAGVTVLRTRADSLNAAGDTAAARRIRADARLLEGFGLWQRGQVDAGAAAMVEAHHAMAGMGNMGNMARWWLGMLHFQAGRWTAAEPYFRSFMKYQPSPQAAYYLGQIYERTGRPERARAMFAFYIEHWGGADAELQPSIQDARQRLARLGPDAPR
jgi:tetratricopeptide (TPR) repeat protein